MRANPLHSICSRVRDRRAARSQPGDNSALSISSMACRPMPSRHVAHVSDPFSSNRTCGVTASGSRTEFTPGTRSHHPLDDEANGCSPYSRYNRLFGNCRVPRLRSLCRRTRNCRSRSATYRSISRYVLVTVP
jgi:hypothetical protein